MPYYGDANGNPVWVGPGNPNGQGQTGWNQTGYSGPGSQYGEPRPAGWTWGPNAPNDFANNNRIDPSTGMFRPGDEGGLVPWQLGLQYQAASDQGIWRLRQSYMRSGINYAKGALGLLQSFRPGGGAAIEANTYGQLGQMEFNRAQMTQPLDLLGDWRREQDRIARSQANRQQERALAVQIAGMAVGAATGGVGGGLIGALFGAAANNMASRGGASTNQSGGGSTAGIQTVPQGQYGPSQYQPLNSGSPVGNVPPPQESVGPMAAGGGGSAMASTIGQGGGGGAGFAGQAGGRSVAPGAMGGWQGQGGPQGGQESAGGGGMAAGGGMVGANGDFSHLAYSANAAAGLAHPLQQLAMERAAAQMVDDDPFFATFSAAVNARWAQRLAA